MKTARIVVLGIALSAGGVAASLASGGSEAPPVEHAAPVAQLPTTDVLVAKNDIGLGQNVKPEDMQWQTWPQATASNAFIRKSDRPDAATQLVGSIASKPLIAGEAIRGQKLVKASGSGFMAAILPSGSRGISTEISPETGAGGFILPNDRVDVILTRRERHPENPSMPEVVVSEIVLSNVRVLAIDQAPKEKEGQTNLVGKTVTLELRPDQTEILARSRQVGTLTLSLRSLTDAKVAEVKADDDALVTVYRGVDKQTYSCSPSCGSR